MENQEIIIRHYRKEDRKAVRDICGDTAFMGRKQDIFFDDAEIIADIFTSYYTDYEPESIFVAESGGRVIGYLTGSKNTAMKERIFSKSILPGIIISFFKKGLIFKKKTVTFLLQAIKSLFKGEFSNPNVPDEYPADLHINIEENFRRSGVGARLMNEYFEYLKKNNVRGVHLSTFSEQGRDFFIKTGFTLFRERMVSLWRYIVKKDIRTSFFGKVLKKDKQE